MKSNYSSGIQKIKKQLGTLMNIHEECASGHSININWMIDAKKEDLIIAKNSQLIFDIFEYGTDAELGENSKLIRNYYSALLKKYSHELRVYNNSLNIGQICEVISGESVGEIAIILDKPHFEVQWVSRSPRHKETYKNIAYYKVLIGGEVTSIETRKLKKI